ncbi:MAG TPA: hypothetical protein VK835_08255 [Bacteroidia bacterium]|jgi:hypothetical protein|nr:hypothetical protein [Bacteroidia bacterium]
MKNLFLIIGVLIVLFSCKKSTDTTTSSGPINTTTTPSYSLDAQGNPGGMYSGMFNVDYSYIYNSPPSIIYSSLFGVSCWFFTAPQSYQNIRTGNFYTTTTNSVIVNGHKFALHNGIYQDSTGVTLSSPYQWTIVGNSNIPSFTYTSITPKPSYSGFWQIPDTVNKQQNLTLPLSGASGYDLFEVDIYDTATYNKHIKYSVSNATSVITIPKDSLTKFISGTGVIIETSLTKFDPQSTGGKKFLFQTTLEYQRTLTIK